MYSILMTLYVRVGPTLFLLLPGCSENSTVRLFESVFLVVDVKCCVRAVYYSQIVTVTCGDTDCCRVERIYGVEDVAGDDST